MKILVAAQAPWIREQLEVGLTSNDVDVQSVTEGSDVRQALIGYEPDVLIADMQSGNMGGVAVAIDARMEAEEDRCKDVAIILLLDREADRLLAERANVDATMVKPIDIFVMNKLVHEVSRHVANHRSEPSGEENFDEVLDVFDEEGLPIHIN
jgi:DNA-binding response OmpR family regulator